MVAGGSRVRKARDVVGMVYQAQASEGAKAGDVMRCQLSFKFLSTVAIRLQCCTVAGGRFRVMSCPRLRDAACMKPEIETPAFVVLLLISRMRGNSE